MLHDLFFQKLIGSLVYMPNYQGKKLEPNSLFKQVFELMTPPKQGVSTNIGQNFSETLQFEDLAIKNFFLFYHLLFCEKKKIELVSNAFFMNEKNHRVFAGFKGGPFEHTKTFFVIFFIFYFLFYFIFMTNAFATNSRFFHNNMHIQDSTVPMNLKSVID